MAKGKKKKETDWDPSAIDAYFDEQAGALIREGKLDSAVFGATSMVGIRLPHLCLRYLFQRSSYPLERTTIVFGPSGCLAGDTLIRMNRGGNGCRRSIAHIVAHQNTSTPPPDRVGRAWDPDIPTMVTRAVGDHTSLARMRSAWACGVKETFTLTTVGGRSIRATADHPFLTDAGVYVRLGDLRPGDAVCVYAGRVSGPRIPKKSYRVTYVRHHPHQRTVPDGSTVLTHRLAYEAKLNGMSTADFVRILRADPVTAATLTYLPRGTFVHHIDNNHLNNAQDNLELVESQAEHNRRHIKPGDTRVLPKIGTDVVASIVRYGEEPTYDLEVDDDPHCYLANDFVVHNSNKSCLVYYFYRLFWKAGGKFLHIEVESKDSPIDMLAMVDYDRRAGWPRACKSLNEFQSTFKSMVDWYKELCAKAGFKKRVPFVIGIDSLTAKMTDDARETADKNDGEMGRRFADEARSLSDWFKYAPSYLTDWPIALFAVNHDKPKTNPKNPMEVIHHTPGGAAPTYNATFRILVQKIRDLDQTEDGWEGNRLKMRMEKNTLGTEKLPIEVEILFRKIRVPNATGTGMVVKQEVDWRWSQATCELLVGLATGKKEGARGQAVRELLGIQGEKRRYWAKGLGVSKDGALPAPEFAALLENSPELLELLEPALGIQPTPEFVPGEDYDDQLTRARAHAEDFLPPPSPTDEFGRCYLTGSADPPETDEAEAADAA